MRANTRIAALRRILTVAQLISGTLIARAAAVFFNSAYQGLLPGVVYEADLADVNAKLLSSQQAAQVAASGLGGLLAR